MKIKERERLKGEEGRGEKVNNDKGKAVKMIRRRQRTKRGE